MSMTSFINFILKKKLCDRTEKGDIDGAFNMYKQKNSKFVQYFSGGT